MQTIENLKTHLQNYPDVNYQIAGNTITVKPLTRIGFEVSLTENESECLVTFDGYPRTFENRGLAIGWFLLGLSEKCRLCVVTQGNSLLGCTIERQFEKEGWRDEYSPTVAGQNKPKFWGRKQNTYLQNNFRRRIAGAPRLIERDPAEIQFMSLFRQMIMNDLIDYRHYYSWADEVIMSRENVPYWVHEIATVKDKREALVIIEEFTLRALNAEFYNFDSQIAVACLMLRYGRGEIDWLTFLKKTERILGYLHRDIWFKITMMEENGDDTSEIEMQDRAEFAQQYAAAIATIAPLYDDFLEYFHAYQARPE